MAKSPDKTYLFEVTSKTPPIETIDPGAGHGFNCGMRADFHQASADLARERTLAFFAEHIGSDVNSTRRTQRAQRGAEERQGR